MRFPGAPAVMVVSAMAMTLPIATAGPVTAQTIPIPFDDAVDTRQISVVVDKGRTSMRGLPGSLRRARERMHARQEVDPKDLRRLAEYGDGLAAQRYVRGLTADGIQPGEASDVAYYAAVAVGTGRVWTLPEMIAAMEMLEPGREPGARIRKYIRVLYAHAWAGNTLALDAVVAFNGDDKLFGTLSDSTRQKILAQAEQNGDGRVELRLALALLERGTLSDAERATARAYLTLANRSSHYGVRITAHNLLALMDKTETEGG
ncbi:hypothetical protein [Cognatishimia sp. F0-27]|uniref:hypothetical protein n=1 Tax=Cognatishimia sp. F0-27 TaxID=2816855 RepID=UPI001D0C0883|nr:hypothetical protein [Cognatishimia sp. F0-27]MCC1494903.1 hypothetical protein [Cognatishimia sp. F0-27]